MSSRAEPVNRARARRLAASAGLLLLGHLATVLVGIATVVAVSRLLDEEALGRWRLAQALVAYLTVAADLGLTTLAVREIARGRDNPERYAGPVLVLRFASGIALTAVALVGVQSAAPDDAKLFYVIAFLAVIPNSLSLLHVLQGRERLRHFAAARFAITAVAGALGLLSLLLTRELITLVVWPLVMGLAVDAWLVWIAVRGLGVRLTAGSSSLWATLLRAGVPFFVAAMSVQLVSSADAVIIGTLRGEAQLGIYAAAYLVAGQLLFLSGPIALAVYPRLASLHQHGPRFAGALEELTGFLGLLVIPVCVVAAVLAEDIVAVLYGARYPEVAPLLRVLIWMPAIGFYNVALAQALNAAGRHRAVMRVSVIAAAISVAANLAIVPAVGLIGAAAVAVLVEAVTAALYTGTGKRDVGVRPLRVYALPLVPAAAMGAVALALSRAETSVPLVLVAAAVVYGILIALRPPAAVATLRKLLSRPDERGGRSAIL